MELSLDEQQRLLPTLGEAFVQARGLLSHQLDSFNRFTDELPQLVLRSLQPLTEVRPDGVHRLARFHFDNVSLERPCVLEAGGPRTLLPGEARLRDLTYAIGIRADFHLREYAEAELEEEKLVQETSFAGVLIGELPVMVKSKYCHLGDMSPKELWEKESTLDPGGYFIVKGVEKVVVPLEGSTMPGMWVPERKGWSITYWCPKESASRYRNRVGMRMLTAKSRRTLYVDIPGIHPLPLVVAMRALGVLSDKLLLQLTTQDLEDAGLTELVKPSIKDADDKIWRFLRTTNTSSPPHPRSRSAALRFLTHHIKKQEDAFQEPEQAAEDILDRNLFPHVGPSNEKKMRILGYMVRNLCLCVLGRRPKEEIDSFKNKRIALVADALTDQLGAVLYRFKKDLSKRIHKHLAAGKEELKDCTLFDKSVITGGLASAFTSGSWVVNRSATSSNKSSQLVATLQRANPMATLSHLRQVRREAAFAGTLASARLPNASHYGRVCPAETPDGENCGLVKSMGLFAVVSGSTPEEHVLEKLWSDCQMVGLDEVPLEGLHRRDKVVLNGTWIGVTDDVEALMATLRRLRRLGGIGSEVELARVSSQNEVRIFTDAGRMLRPLLVVDQSLGGLGLTSRHKSTLAKLEPSQRLSELFHSGIVELVGAQEEQNCVVALFLKDLAKGSSKFTHLELHPTSLLGLGASMIPFLGHNQSSRVTHQAQKHGKQAMGFYSTTLRPRLDTAAHELFYPQRPLVKTQAADLLDREQNYAELSNGQNCIVAVACFSGYNQEDSLIINQSSLDRSLFRSSHYQTFKAVLEANEELRATSETVEPDGLPQIGKSLLERDVVIGKMTRRKKVRDSSVKLRNRETGKVDKVMITTTGPYSQRNWLVKVRLSSIRSPEAGDKFSSMHGQKGVVGFCFGQEDMPFTRQGIVPDVIINPHAFPTRQTLAQLFESASGKATAVAGEPVVDATPFAETSAEDVGAALHRMGFAKSGAERLYSGQTGQPMEMTTIGITFYQRLNHMAADKLKWRGSGGLVQQLTRQPVRDRKSGGGIGFGEMERDCLIAHGTSAALQERLFLLSDPSQVIICSSCGRLFTGDPRKLSCKFCKTRAKFVTLDMPYACRLLHSELSSVCVDMRFKVK